jgi:serine/threonine protein kinase
MSHSPHSDDAPMDAAMASLEPGFLVGNGRFTLIRLIGRGGMGVVWLARDESLREDVALKFLPQEIRFDAAALDDLRRETARARKLTHPNIIRIHDLYKDEREAFISMEYIDGPNLADLRVGQPERVFTWIFLEPLVKQLCDALDYAHGEKVVHRDLKPANMMLDSRGRLKLSDFGIAAQVSDSVSRVSMIRHGQSGTITYMSPQQMDGKLPQVTDDIYALGATLYELLASRPPFFTGDIAHQVRNLLPQPLDERLAELGIENEVPASLRALIMACLGKTPEQRPSSARAVAEWIGLPPVPAVARASEPEPLPTVERTRVELPVSYQPPTAAPVEAYIGADVANEASTFTTRGPASSTRLMLVVLAIVVVTTLGMGITAWWLWKRGTSRIAAAGTISSENSSTAVTASIVDEAGFVNLFNGRDLSGWSGDTADWSVRDGVIRGQTGRRPPKNSSGLFWQGEPLEDFELRLKFQRWSGNSGVFYRAKRLSDGVGGYQFEILSGITGNLIDVGNDRPRRDLFRVNSTAARRSLPKLPPDSGWHELVIIARGSQLIHQLDGITLCDLRDEDSTAPRTGLLALEAASDTIVEFKDIRLKRLTAEPSTPAPPANVGKWTTLFNGTSMDSWRAWKSSSWIGAWSILNQDLHSLRGGTIHLATREQYGDFELELEWKVTPGANSGILYRATPDMSEVWKAAPEYQIVDDLTHRDGQTPNTSAGSLFSLIAPANKTLRPPGEFNSARIIARGSHVEHWLNGTKILETDLSRPDLQRVARQRFEKTEWGTAPRGHIVLQHLGSEVSFRNIRVRRLDGN